MTRVNSGAKKSGLKYISLKSIKKILKKYDFSSTKGCGSGTCS